MTATPAFRLAPLLLAGATGLAILLALGTWQLQRRAEKAAVLSALDRAATAAPRTLTAAEARALAVLPAGSAGEGPGELTRVSIAGRFLDVAPVPVRVTLPPPRQGSGASGIGFFVMSPFRVDGDAVVFVNRGFVPAGPGWRPPPLPAPPPVTQVTGLLRRPETGTLFGPSDRPEQREFFNRDPAALARAAGLPEALPWFLDEERGERRDGPAGADVREMVARIPNNHLQYALTWYGLALTLAGVLLAFLRSGRRETS